MTDNPGSPTRTQPPSIEQNTARMARFFETLESARRPLLMLDYDGTLAPFTAQRDRATPYPGIRPVIGAILKPGRCRVVIVSGRPAMEAARLLGVNQEVEVFGVHGLERLFPGGRLETVDIGLDAARGLERAMAWADEAGLPGHLEHKRGAVAIYWRGLSPGEKDRIADSARPVWSKIAASHGLEVRDFDGGIEIRVPGLDKGLAVRTIVEESDPDAAAYLGDDLTDEDAFLAMEEPGLTVLIREKWRPTAARVWLRPPIDLLAFLIRFSKAVAEG